MNSETFDKHRPLVENIAGAIFKTLPHFVLMDDLIQAGVIGLMDAVEKFDESKGASFKSYAGIRIRGAIIDDLRKTNTASRNTNRDKRLADEALRECEQKLLRYPTQREVADHMGISVSALYDILVKNRRSYPISDEDSWAELEAEPGRAEFGDIEKMLNRKITRLPFTTKQAIYRHFYHDMTPTEISRVDGQNDSNSWQSIRRGVERLRVGMKA